MPDLIGWIAIGALLVGAPIVALGASIGPRLWPVTREEFTWLAAKIMEAKGAVDQRRFGRNGRDTPELSRRSAVLGWTQDRLHDGMWSEYSGAFSNGWAFLIGRDAVNGSLFQVRDRAGNSVSFLIVACPSKKDWHVLIVPNTCRSPKEARAWTFGMAEEKFDLETET